MGRECIMVSVEQRECVQTEGQENSTCLRYVRKTGVARARVCIRVGACRLVGAGL